MSTASRLRLFTPAEYLEFERRSESKHEYRHGQIVAMPGTSLEHNLILMNLGRILGNQLLGRPCFVFANDVRVCVDPEGFYTYPDLIALCGRPDLLRNTFDTLLNPGLIVEILSPSTESYDRGEKFDQYRGIASLREYLLISQDQTHVEHHVLRDGKWVRDLWTEPGDIMRFESIGCEASLADIYDKVPLLREP